MSYVPSHEPFFTDPTGRYSVWEKEDGGYWVANNMNGRTYSARKLEWISEWINSN